MVVFPETTAEVQLAVAACHALGIAVTPCSATKSLEGGVAAVRGGLSLDLTRMTRILELNADDMDCAVEAWVTGEDLNLYLRDQGLCFRIDPGANVTLGVMASTRASGTTAVRYGTMRHNVLWLTVVLVNGTRLRTAQRARKSSDGYDLTALFVGSEGTLGVITEVGLGLQGITVFGRGVVRSGRKARPNLSTRRAL